jgi:hypothetical protein
VIFCLVCGVGNRAGSRFCNACGRPVGAVVACAGCGTPNPPGSRFCNACGGPLEPPELAAPREPRALAADWRESIASAAMLGADDATWAAPPTGAHPARSLTGVEPLSPEELDVFALPTPPRPESLPGAPAGPPLARPRWWDAHRGPTRAPSPLPGGVRGDVATLLERISGSATTCTQRSAE